MHLHISMEKEVVPHVVYGMIVILSTLCSIFVECNLVFY